MYQVPVNDLARLRRSRKRVKSILCDIALQSCQDLIEEYRPFDAGEASFNNTEWSDFTDGHIGRRKKKWKYRTEALCCSLCWFSTRSFYTFRSHVMRCHREELDLASLLTCPNCPFVSRPESINQHLKYFHPMPTKPASAAPTMPAVRPPKPLTLPTTSALADDKYMCVNCGYTDSLLYVMKKHVLVNHYSTLLNRYFGHRLESAQNVVSHNKSAKALNSKYYCKECKLPAETIEHLLYHILSSDKHKDLHWQIMPFINERHQTAGQGNFMSLTSNLNQGKNLSMVTGSSFDQMKGRSVAKSNGTMFMAGPSNTTGLLCATGGRQVFLSSHTPALLQQQASSGIHHGLTTLSSSSHVKSINMVMPHMQNASKQVPMTVPRFSQSQSAQQMLLPPGVQVSIPGRASVRPPMFFTHRLQLNQSAARQPILASQSVRLIPTGNKVNGVPTYTLAPVQVNAVAGQASSSQVVNRAPTVLSQNGPQSPASVPSKAAVLSAKPASSGVPRKRVRINRLAVFAPFLKKQKDNAVKCLRCKVFLTEQWIFQHLLHGLKCLFCPLMFYSFKQIMEHSNKEHSLTMKKNRDFIKGEYKLDCDDEGNIEFSTFSLNTDVPKDLIDNRELNLVLVTSAQEKIYIKMYPDSAKAVYPPTLKTIPSVCPFCQKKLQSLQDYEHHLKTIHHIVPTIHAILKTPAFKCIYCFGVYSEKSTPKTISVHVQRCRCAPKSVKEAEKRLNPDMAVHVNGDIREESFQPHIIINDDDTQTTKTKRESSANRNIRASKNDVCCAPVELTLDPTGLEMKSFEDRKEFLTKYFHSKPYPSKMEMLTLAARLWLNKTDVLHHFGMKRSRCMKTIQKRRTVVLLGFNMNEVNKVKHNLLIPEVQSAN